jgi:hypothetical protein
MRYRETCRPRQSLRGERKPSARQPGVSPFIDLSHLPRRHAFSAAQNSFDVGARVSHRQRQALLVKFAYEVGPAGVLARDIG